MDYTLIRSSPLCFFAAYISPLQRSEQTARIAENMMCLQNTIVRVSYLSGKTGENV